MQWCSETIMKTDCHAQAAPARQYLQRTMLVGTWCAMMSYDWSAVEHRAVACESTV